MIIYDKMKNFKQNVYSKTYTDQNHNKSQTLIVDNVKYRLNKNKKTMVKVNNDGKQKESSTLKLPNQPRSTSNQLSKLLKVNKQYRILKENNLRFSSFKRNLSFKRSTKSFKCANKSKFKLILKKPNRFKFNKLNESTRVNSKLVNSTNLYKKIYNNVPRNDLKRNQIQQIRKKALKLSINCLLKKNNDKLKNDKLKLSKINTTYCMFYCRFGKCAKMDTCIYKHDKDKVAVCKNFLKGKCEDVNSCLLSHKIDPKNMPVCSYFLRGICNIDNCPYRHVNVNENAEICKDFLRGFCVRGDQCKLLHQYAQDKCKKSIVKKKNNRDHLVNGNSNANQPKDNKIVDFIELVGNESNMEISDNDICRDELVADKDCLDFIPLFKDSNDSNEDDGRRSRANEESNVDINAKESYTNDCLTLDYDSDDTWFEDDGLTSIQLFQYIPEFLLE